MSNEITIGNNCYWMSSFTGTARGVRRWTESTVSGSGSSLGGTYQGTGGGGGSVNISTTHVEYCEFFLAEGGREERFRSSGMYKAFLDGHTLTVAWVGRAGEKGGSVVFIRNHTTSEDEINAGALSELLIPFWPSIFARLRAFVYVSWSIFIGLPLAFGLGALGYWVAHSGGFAAFAAIVGLIGPQLAFYLWERGWRAKREMALAQAVYDRVGAGV